MSIGRAFDFKKATNPVFIMDSVSFRQRKFAKSMEIGLKNLKNGSYDLKSRNQEQNPFFTSRLRLSNLSKNNSISFKSKPQKNCSLNLKNQIFTIEKNVKKSKRFQNFLNFVITPDKLNKRTEKRGHKSLNYQKNHRSTSITSKFLEKTQLNTSRKFLNKQHSNNTKNRKRKKMKNKNGNLKKSTSTNNYVKVKSIFGKKKKPRSRKNFNKIPYSHFFYRTECSEEKEKNSHEKQQKIRKIDTEYNRDENKENKQFKGAKSTSLKRKKKHFFNMKQIELYKKMLKKGSKNKPISFLDVLNNPNLIRKKKHIFKTEQTEESEVKRPKSILQLTQKIKKKVKLKKPTISQKKNGSIFSFAVNSHIEDSSKDMKRISIYFNKIKTNIKRHKVNFSFIGLYQGYSSPECCDFFKNNLHKFIVGNPNLPSDVFKAIQSGIHRCQKLYFDSLGDHNQNLESSSSATLMITIDERLFIVTIGNGSVLLSLENGSVYKIVGSTQVCEKPLLLGDSRLKTNCISAETTRRYNTPPIDIQELRIGDSIDYGIIPSKEVMKAMDKKLIFRTAQSSILNSEAEKRDNHESCGDIVDLILRETLDRTEHCMKEGIMTIALFLKDITGSERIKEEASFDQGSMMIVTSGNKFSFRESKSAGSLFKKLDLTKTISKKEKMDNAQLVDGIFDERVLVRNNNDSFGFA